jgi:hypothetical protein
MPDPITDALERKYPGTTLIDRDQQYLYFGRPGGLGCHRIAYAILPSGGVALGAEADHASTRRGPWRRSVDLGSDADYAPCPPWPWGY